MNKGYRRALIAGNWKMNKKPSETSKFINQLRVELPKGRACDVALCVPHVCITNAVRASKECRIAIGAENCSENPSGAYTGEVSADMVADAGCKYVIIGHSERRAMGETDDIVNAKVRAALDAGLTPIVCCGETLKQREQGITEEWITMQVKLALYGLTLAQIRRVVIAYEPIWAIGTGLTATAEQAQEICKMIRKVIRTSYKSAPDARRCLILYGGSVNEKNAHELFSQPDIDGGLIGGASLDVSKLAEIIRIGSKIAETSEKKRKK